MGWREELERLPRIGPDFTLEARRTALLIVDMTYFDAHPDYGIGPGFRSFPELGAYYFGRLREMVIPNHRRLLEFFHGHNLKVIYLTVGCHLSDKSDTPFIFARLKKYLPTPKDVANQVLEEIKPQEGDLVVHKSSSGAFNSTDIEHLLRHMGITSLVVTGVATPFCVDTTARDAADRGFRTVIVDDACATHTQAMHDATLVAFASVFGRVLSTQEVMAEMERGLG